jgi:hypothetical protein
MRHTPVRTRLRTPGAWLDQGRAALVKRCPGQAQSRAFPWSGRAEGQHRGRRGLVERLGRIVLGGATRPLVGTNRRHAPGRGELALGQPCPCRGLPVRASCGHPRSDRAEAMPRSGRAEPRPGQAMLLVMPYPVRPCSWSGELKPRPLVGASRARPWSGHAPSRSEPSQALVRPRSWSERAEPCPVRPGRACRPGPVRSPGSDRRPGGSAPVRPAEVPAPSRSPGLSSTGCGTGRRGAG